jgi:hypothetical protein
MPKREIADLEKFFYRIGEGGVGKVITRTAFAVKNTARSSQELIDNLLLQN